MNKMYKDGVTPRLFLIAENQIAEKLKHIKEIKRGVWLIQGTRNKWIIKEFRTLPHLQLQQKFTYYLKVNGFPNTYTIDPVHMELDDRIFGLLEYIPSRTNDFTYKKEKHIFEAFHLLHNFHVTTNKFVSDFKEVPVFDPFGKWQSRLVQFEKWLVTSTFQTSQFLQKMIEYGEWSLEHLANDPHFIDQKREYILHGDVAHHNFLKSKDGMLYLIDFDLIKMGSKEIDYLQLANRVLPGLKWDVDRLFQIPEIAYLKDNPAFLCALVYPTDIYRECLVHGEQNPEYLSSVFSLQNQRIACYERIKSAFAVYE